MTKLAQIFRALLPRLGLGAVQEDDPEPEFDARWAELYRSELYHIREKLIWVTVTRGLYRTKGALRSALDKAGIRYKPASLQYPEVAIARERTDIDLTAITVGGLRFKEGATLRQIYERAMLIGLELCPPEVAALLRLKYRDQRMGETLFVAMEPIASDEPGIETPYPIIFAVARSTCKSDPLLLDDPFALETKKYPLDARFVFVMPRV